MKVGVAMPFNQHTSPERIVEAAQAVEAAGFDSLWVPEHVVFFSSYESTYPYAEDGRIPGEPDGLLDPFTALTFVAAHTTTLRLGTGICLVPQRQPVYTARMVADLDYLSAGRVEFGIGVGWCAEEFAALGIPFERRGARTNDAIDAMKALWAPGENGYQGEFYSFEPCHFNPRPVQAPHPPLLIGGESAGALERVATHGDGWYCYDRSPAALAEALPRLEEALARHGRNRSEVRLYVGSDKQPITSDSVQQYRDLGVDHLIVPMLAQRKDKLEARMARVLGALR